MQKQNNSPQDVEKKQTAAGQQDQKSNKGFEKPVRRDEEMDDEEDQSKAQAPSREKESMNRTKEQNEKV
jgi:hypothetical protein